MRTLLLARHGETYHNTMIDGAKTTVKDPNNLTSKGKKQADLLEGVITRELGLKVDVAFHSALARTRQTAMRALRGHKTPLWSLTELNEVNLGIVQDVPREEYYDDSNELFARLRRKKEADWLGFRPPGGQTHHEKRAELEIAWRKSNQKAAPSACVAWFTSSQTCVSALSLPQLLGLTSKQLMSPLHPAWPNPRWVQNAQLFVFTAEDPQTGRIYPSMQFYRVMAPFKKPLGIQQFDTGWQLIKR